jgi:hypothetical protein
LLLASDIVRHGGQVGCAFLSTAARGNSTSCQWGRACRGTTLLRPRAIAISKNLKKEKMVRGTAATLRMRTSSFVHGRVRVTFFAISAPCFNSRRL